MALLRCAVARANERPCIAARYRRCGDCRLISAGSHRAKPTRTSPEFRDRGPNPNGKSVMKVRIVDNGLRCFAEPCDSWDVFDEYGTKIAVVSRLLSSRGVLLGNIDRNAYYFGEVRQYQVESGPNAGQISLLFAQTD